MRRGRSRLLPARRNRNAPRPHLQHRLRRWLRRIISASSIVCAFAVAGILYENISEPRDRRYNPMPGQLLTSAVRACTSTAPARDSRRHSRVRSRRFLSLVAQGAAADREVYPRLFLRSRRPRLQRLQSVTPHQQSNLPRNCTSCCSTPESRRLMFSWATPWADSTCGSTPAFIAAKWPAWCSSMRRIPIRRNGFRPNLKYGRNLAARGRVS